MLRSKTMSSNSVPAKNFRPEIQALRALAVLLVVAYHLEPGLLPGGYIGVDIFFVISGFLITGHLLREAQRTATVNLPAFFAARARRILPAALVVIAAVVGGSLLLLPRTQWQELGIQALASTFSVQNWVLAADSVDYLAADQAPGPLQHFWSLGVEEQFYLFWPLLVLGACWLSARTGRGAGTPARLERVLWVGFSVAAGLSLSYSVLTGYRGNAAGYFITTTRIWELAAGGLLALAVHAHAAGRLRLPRWVSAWSVRNAAVLLGLALILWAAGNYDAATVFPGIAAALPVLACAAIIAAGDTSGPGSLRPVVHWRWVQWVGLASYSLYLWHWPLIVFAEQFTGANRSPVESLVLLGISLALAAASLYLVENPARNYRPLAGSPPRALGAGAVAMGLVALLALTPVLLQQQSIDREQREVTALLNAPPQGFGAASVTAGAPALLPRQNQIVPIPATAEQDQPQLGSCVQEPQSTSITECEFGSPQATFTVALVGDSHAAHWYEALHAHAAQRGWRVITYLKNSCPYSAGERTAERQGSISCRQATEQTTKLLTSRTDIDAVVTANWAGAEFVGDPAQGYAQLWGELEDAGLDVFAVVDTPRPGTKQYARDCVQQHQQDLSRCSVARSKAFERGDVTREAAAREPRVQVLDFSDQFCIAQRCPAVIGNVLVYRDKHHISDTYMRTLAPVFGQRLEAALDGR